MNTDRKNEKADDVYETSPAGTTTALHAVPARGSSVPRQLEQSMSPDFDPLVSPAEAGRLLSIHRVTVWVWVKRSILPQPIRITSRKVGFRRSTIEALLRSREQGGQA